MDEIKLRTSFNGGYSSYPYLSELIEDLTKVLNEYGDKPVIVNTDDSIMYELNSIYESTDNTISRNILSYYIIGYNNGL